MKNVHVILCKGKLLLVQYVEILHTNIVFLIEETLFLNTCHVKNVKLRNCILQTFYFYELDVVLLQYVFTDIAGNTKLFRRNQYEFNIVVANQRLDQRVNGTSEFQISAQTDGNVVKTSL